MSLAPSLLESAVDTALGGLLSANLAVPVVRGQVNRVPQPAPAADSVVFWPVRRPRLATNAENQVDVKFTASIALTVMTVSAVLFGVIVPGTTLSGVGVTAGTTIVSQSSGPPGGAGIYVVSISQTVASESMSTGSLSLVEETEAVYQIDVHGPNSADNAQVVATLLWSQFATDSMFGSGVTPLHCEDPRQVPFMTAADQYVERWVVEAHFQVNPAVSIPQQYADQLAITTSPQF